ERDAGQHDADDAGPRVQRDTDERRQNPSSDKLEDEGATARDEHDEIRDETGHKAKNTLDEFRTRVRWLNAPGDPRGTCARGRAPRRRLQLPVPGARLRSKQE